jgi:hypothetical protein
MVYNIQKYWIFRELLSARPEHMLHDTEVAVALLLPVSLVCPRLDCDVLRRSRENVRRKRPVLWRNHNWLLHHYNTPAHTFLKTRGFMINSNVIIIPDPPYSSGLASCDFALFPKFKMKLKGRRFETVSDIQRESQAVLDSIKENDFHGAFEALKKKQKTMGSLYMYPRRPFEGDGSQNLVS